jgi:hypothetical protein
MSNLSFPTNYNYAQILRKKNKKKSSTDDINKYIKDESEKNRKNYKKYVVVWKKYIKIDENINLLLPDELLILSKYDFKDPDDIPHPPYKYPRVNFLVFDDLVGDPHAFKKGHSAINNLTIRHRHLQCNLCPFFFFPPPNCAVVTLLKLSELLDVVSEEDVVFELDVVSVII